MPRLSRQRIRRRRHLPCRRLDVVVHPGAEPWAPSPAIMRELACRITRDLRVEIAPRSMVAAIWSRDHEGRPLPVRDPYAFRAYARNGRAVVFVDHTETPGSALWVLLHELAHLELESAGLLRDAYRNFPKPPDYLTSDVAHEAHPEEQLANLVATRTLHELGLPPAQLDRLWWRRRVNQLARPR